MLFKKNNCIVFLNFETSVMSSPTVLNFVYDTFQVDASYSQCSESNRQRKLIILLALPVCEGTTNSHVFHV